MFMLKYSLKILRIKGWGMIHLLHSFFRYLNTKKLMSTEQETQMQPCVLCSFVRCGTSKTNRKKKEKKKEKKKKIFKTVIMTAGSILDQVSKSHDSAKVLSRIGHVT